MKKITTVVASATFATSTMFAMSAMCVISALVATVALPGTAAAGGPPIPEHRQPVSKAQYRVLMSQCEYADTAKARRDCRKNVENTYTIGKTSTTLDCRTYSGVTVCGVLMLSARARQCIRRSVENGLSYRRSEVECYVFH